MTDHPSFQAVEEKMRAASVSPSAIAAFRRNHSALARNESGMIPETSILPVESLPEWEKISHSQESNTDLLAQCVVIKLNGGLGTSMGLQSAKSLLAVRDGSTFLDIIALQINRLRQASGKNIRLLLMNSFSTSEDTLRHMQRYAPSDLARKEEVELMQNQVPKLDAVTLAPASWTTDSDLEWCPPGHGDIYPALAGSGWLDKLLDSGVKYAFVSNSDNLGAIMDPRLLTYFANSNAPFLMEVTRRTPADRKGGHLAIRKNDSQLLLREVAQCPSDDTTFFQDIERHRYFNTNNLWLRLDILKERLAECDGALPLPMIVNRKTIDPRDKNSTPVIQLEVAMGAAIECFTGSTALDVPRSRFAPVKTTADLFALRSDAYYITPDGSVSLRPERNGTPPDVRMDDSYKLVDSIEDIIPPSLLHCHSLTINGSVTFSDNVTILGDVTFINTDSNKKIIAPGEYSNITVTL